jgi:hypothetical protein
MSPWWLLLVVPSVLVVGAALGAYGIEMLNKRKRPYQKGEFWGLPSESLPSPPDPSPSQGVQMARVRFGTNRPGHRRNLRGHRPE